MYKGRTGKNNQENDESSEYRDAYSNLSKSALVQNSKIFNDKKLKDTECIDLLNKVIFLLNQVSRQPDPTLFNTFAIIACRAKTSPTSRSPPCSST